MIQFSLKVLITALVVSGASELAKRSSTFGALLASLPLTSILAMIWIYRDSSDLAQISRFSYGVFWAVLPSLVFFLALPLLLKRGLGFPMALGLSSLIMFGSYSVYVWAMNRLGVEL